MVEFKTDCVEPRPVPLNPKFKEAYRLMKYVNPEDGFIEWIWNSRDGISPFMTLDKRNGGMMQHVDWHEDMFIPNFVPAIGSRIFMNLDVEIRGDQDNKYQNLQTLEGAQFNVQCEKVDAMLYKHFQWLSSFRPFIPPQAEGTAH